MEKQEFFLLIPAIIYGVAIVDLLKVFGHKKNYFELVGWGIFCMVAVVFSWTELYDRLDEVVEAKSNFYVLIVQAIIIARIATIITPEEKHVDTKKYFYSIYKKFFLFLALSAFINMLSQYFIYNDNSPLWIRPLLISLMLVCAYNNKVWIRTTVLTFVMIIAVIRIFSDFIR